MLSFIDWLPEEAIKKKRKKMTQSQISKEIQKSGMLINKDKLIEHIKKSPQTTFTLLQSPNAKEMIVTIGS